MLSCWYMDHEDFMYSLRHGTPDKPAYQTQGRVYKSASGVDTFIHLNTCHWEYVDWLEDQGDIDFAEWVIHCDANPCEGYTLSHHLMYWLWTDECRRHRYGAPTPSDTPPDGYTLWEPASNDG